ncbi:LysR family transcriptional regulator [Pantoea sp. 18069]|uniref:LysR family transcriptional regulator n=1 Tax=Pantoea sp. 18069 TaxID=2681415 RepID=UPI00135703DA|nr:LysR family transcriptional regulator [Pantoea sp. 18069]
MHSSTPPPRYSLRQLRYFVVTAEALSFTAASKQLHISQPAISSTLADLEDSFGVQLFIRHHASGLSLTQSGKDMLALARNLLKSADELQTAASDLDGGMRGQIYLGCLITLAPSLLPQLISRFMAQHRSMRFDTCETDQQDLLARLQDGRVDIGLTYNLDLPPDILFTPLVDLPPYIILPKQHRLAGAGAVSLSSLLDEPYVMLDLPHSREYFASLFDVFGRQPEAAFRSSQPEVIRGMVANGLGYSMLNFPLRSTCTVDGKEFAICEVQEKAQAMTLGIARLRSMRQRKAVHLFEQFCTEVLSENTKLVQPLHQEDV